MQSNVGERVCEKQRSEEAERREEWRREKERRVEEGKNSKKEDTGP